MVLRLSLFLWFSNPAGFRLSCHGHQDLVVLMLDEQAKKGECYTPKLHSGRTKVWPLGAEVPECEPFPPRVLATVGFPIGSRGVISGRFKLVLYI